MPASIDMNVGSATISAITQATAQRKNIAALSYIFFI
jgi:hypothetical protein